MGTRLYKVGIGGHVHLVEAATKEQAVRHVTKGKVTAVVLSAKECAKFMQEGHKVEVAGAEEESKEEEGSAT